MTNDDFLKLKAGMPWTEHSELHGRQTVIRIFDRHGQEVPLLTVVAFTLYITAHLARTKEKNDG